MGTDCGLLIKIKNEKKYYRRMFDRLYCFEHIGVGPDFSIEHDGLKDDNDLEDGPMINGMRSVRATDEIKHGHAIQWAKDRIYFLTNNRAAIEKEDSGHWRVDYHLQWVTDFLKSLEKIKDWPNVETIWLAADDGSTYNDIVFDGENVIIDLP